MNANNTMIRLFDDKSNLAPVGMVFAAARAEDVLTVMIRGGWDMSHNTDDYDRAVILVRNSEKIAVSRCGALTRNDALTLSDVMERFRGPHAVTPPF